MVSRTPQNLHFYSSCRDQGKAPIILGEQDKTTVKFLDKKREAKSKIRMLLLENS